MPQRLYKTVYGRFLLKILTAPVISKMAGALGLAFVMIFMVAYYRVPGIIANFALVIYGLILFALFKII